MSAEALQTAPNMWQRMRPVAVGALAVLAITTFKVQPIEAGIQTRTDVAECKAPSIDPANNFEQIACEALIAASEARQAFLKVSSLKRNGDGFWDQFRRGEFLAARAGFRRFFVGSARSEVEKAVASPKWKKNETDVRGNPVVNNIEIDKFSADRAEGRAVATTQEKLKVFNRSGKEIYDKSGRRTYVLCQIPGKLKVSKDWVVASHNPKFDCDSLPQR